MRRIGKTVLSLAVALTAAGVVSASPAAAEGVWWHLTSGARPAYLKAGLAQTEVKRLTVQQTAGFYALEEPASIKENGAKENINYVELPFNSSAAQIQTGLELLYGGGNVEVSESAAKQFTITFKGERADRPVELRAEGEVTITELSAGRPDGEIYVTAENLGDQTVTENALSGPEALTLTDTLPPGLKAVGIIATKPRGHGAVNFRNPIACSLASLSCRLSEPANEAGAQNAAAEILAPYAQVEMRIAVVVEPGASASPQSNAVSISGGESFSCQPVTAGTGAYSDSGCVNGSGEGSFDRVSNGPPEPASISRPVTLSEAPAPFGVEEYDLTAEEAGGALARQAGSHPFQLTTTITLNQGTDTAIAGEKPSVNPVQLAKDLHFKWPAGLIGNPSALPQCTEAQFYTANEGWTLCPADSAVGVATVTANEKFVHGVVDVTVPVFNLVPAPGEPARFGFFVVTAGTAVIIDTHVRSGGDYGVTVTSNNIPQTAAFLSSQVTVWGVPGDPAHNRQRGWACLFEGEGSSAPAGELGSCASTETKPEAHPPAFLSMPTSCTGELVSTVTGDSWVEPLPEDASPTLAESKLPGLHGCNRLPFAPSIEVKPDGTAGSTPTGLNVDVHVPQGETLNAEGLAEAAPKDITVALPEGVAINPASGDGLTACSEALAGFTGFAELDGARTATFTEGLPSPLQQAVNFCPDASKIGTVKIKTPILPNPIEGSVYIASQNENPFGGLVAIYLIAEDPVSGVVIKLVGETQLTGTGQIVTTFHDSPQAPFEDAELHFFGGERAPLATPSRCGSYTTAASMTPWSGNPPVSSSSTFDITSGPNGGPCPGASLPFSPTLTGGTTNVSAGSFSPLTTTISREDGQQDLQRVQLHMPAGVSGILKGVKLCDEADANAGACGPESLIGETTVSAGVGSDPVSVKGGKVYLTEKYAGSPFGLSIVNPVKAGPFDLEHDTSNPANDPACDCLVVRARIDVDPHTAALTITTDPSGAHAIPHIIDGIPVQIQKVNVLINRPGFTFNPTDCNPMAITGAIGGEEGAIGPVSVPLQVTNCAALKFTPKFAVSTAGKNSKANGATLTAKLSYPQGPQGTYANITRVKVDLPKQLPSRLTTLQKACTNAQFEANPANCPAASKIGMATVTTPLLPVPLVGPAIFVSHGGEAFPSLTMVLQGYGVTVDLVGTTFISSKGITSTTFKTVPDVPFNTFQLTLPQGKFSALAANVPAKAHYSLCGQTLSMPTEFLAQNGAKINETTKISVSGCAKKKTLTRPQKLTGALKVCHKKAKGKRAGCEKSARKEFGPVKKSKKLGGGGQRKVLGR